MTDNDLRTQLASIQTSQAHIMEQLREAAEHRRERDRDFIAILNRITVLETDGKALGTLPGRVQETALAEAKAEATRDAKGEAAHVLQQSITLISTVAGTIGALAGMGVGVVMWLTNGG